MAKLREAPQIIGALEDGELARDFSAEIRKVLETLREHAAQKGSASGSVTLKLNFRLEGSSVDIDADFSSVTPKKKRVRSTFFSVSDGLSTEHPRQVSMFEGENIRAIAE